MPLVKWQARLPGNWTMIFVTASQVMLYAASRCYANVCRSGILTWFEQVGRGIRKGRHKAQPLQDDRQGEGVSLMRLANKVAIITGSASGMGQTAAELFA